MVQRNKIRRIPQSIYCKNPLIVPHCHYHVVSQILISLFLLWFGRIQQPQQTTWNIFLASQLFVTPTLAFVITKPIKTATISSSTTTTTSIITPQQRQPLTHMTGWQPRGIGEKNTPCDCRHRMTQLYGIKGFRSWFESQFPDAMTILMKSDERAHDTFDHVLIDMNQLLHVVLRKSKSETHALTLLMQEVDACIALATPTQSLVLAFDGPPGAAKLATQRKRRFGTVYKTNAKVTQLEKLIASIQNGNNSSSNNTNNTNNSNHTSTRTTTKQQSRLKQWVRKKSRAAAETRTLCITPATEFMKLSEEAILYWAWQRLSARYTSLSTYNVKIFISSSTVPGEGEVKLLEWIYNKQRKGESIAILGGDSDLVLEALVIPMASTHNVFVLLPDGNKRYIAVSLWETTRTLGRYLPHSTISSVIKVRTDLVLLLILNGNDYLPKLRGSSGFNKLFHTYLRLQREWHNAGNGTEAYFVNPDTLQFNLPFAIAYFQGLAAMVPPNVLLSNSYSNNSTTISQDDRSTPLQELNNLMDAGFFPKPMKFVVISDGDEGDGNDDDIVDGDIINDDINDNEDPGDVDMDAGDECNNNNNDEEGEMMRLRLTLGEPKSEDFLTYEIWIPRGSSLKKGKHKLAAIAIAELNDENDLMVSEDDVDEDDDSETADTTLDGYDQIAVPSYDWEIRHIVPGEIEPYLYGLLWNLQTYQDGVCADYSYNYGKRLSPLAQDIANFFQQALRENRTVGPMDLHPAPFSPPVSAGLSCLAALPSPVKHLVPQPYRSIPDDLVELYYSMCMDPTNNVFDINRFQLLCEEHIVKHNLATRNEEKNTMKNGKSQGGRSTLADVHYWTIISKVTNALEHPFDPPKPISERFAILKGNNKIRISRSTATAVPPRRSIVQAVVDGTNGANHTHSHSYPGNVLEKLGLIEEVTYRVAYHNHLKKEIKKSRPISTTAVTNANVDIVQEQPKIPRKTNSDVDIVKEQPKIPKKTKTRNVDIVKEKRTIQSKTKTDTDMVKEKPKIQSKTKSKMKP